MFRSKADFELIKRLRSGFFGSAAHVRRCSSTDNSSEYLLKDINLTQIERQSPEEMPEIASGLIDTCRNEYERLAKQQIDNHLNIARIFGTFQEIIDGDLLFFVVIEYCDGGDLGQVIAEAHDPLPEQQVLNWTRQLMSAVKFLHHDKNQPHGDIRSPNVFLVSNWQQVKLGDFGPSRLIERATQNISKTTVATWPYASPQFCSGLPYTKKCDIWSLGVLIFELANLKRPFPGEGTAVVTAIVLRPPQRFVENGNYPPELATAVMAMLEKDAEKRPAIERLLEENAFLRSGERIRQISVDSNSSQFTQRFSDQEDDNNPQLHISLHLDMVRDSHVINQVTKDTICSILESELINAEELAELTDDEVLTLFPNEELRFAFFQWREDFATKKPQRLLAASQRGDVDVLRKILLRDNSWPLLFSQEIWAAIDQDNGDRPLHRASRFGQVDAVKFLVEECSALTNEENERGDIPVTIAAQQGHLGVVRNFLDRVPALIEATTRNGRTAFLNATLTPGNVAMLELLMSKGADVDVKCNELDCNNLAIHLAAEFGDVETVSFLLGLNPQNWLEAKNCNNDTPLNRAAISGHFDTVRYLVCDKKADIENRGDNGWTPLIGASANGHLQIVELLLENGADVEAKDDENGNTALHLAAFYGHADVVEHLVRKANSPSSLKNAENVEGCTPIFYAVQQNKDEIVKFLQNN